MEFKTDLERELFHLSTKNAAEHDKLLAERDELLAALVMAESAMTIAQAVMKIPHSIGADTWGRVISQANEAIAKAKGGE